MRRHKIPLSCLVIFGFLGGCATVDKNATDTVILPGVVEKVYAPCTQSMLSPGAQPEQPPGVALIAELMKPLTKKIDHAISPRECLYLIRSPEVNQIYFRTSKNFAVGSCVTVYLMPATMAKWKAINPLLTNTFVEPLAAIEDRNCPVAQ